ncbi:MAG: caspase, EACC1-associated type [Anaerolineales bacterium]
MAESRFALLITSHDYADPGLHKLIAPSQDALALERVLKDIAIGGFEVRTLLNQPSPLVFEEIEAFYVDRRKDDLTLLYFSGHGVKDIDGELYFAMANTRLNRIRSTAIKAHDVNALMRRSRAQTKLLVLDCCYSGAFALGMTVKSAQYLAERDYFEGRGTAILTASSAIQYAFEGEAVTGEGTQSVFTRVLIAGIESGAADLNGDGVITFDEVYEYIDGHVRQVAPQQEPRKWELDVQGQIVLARNPSATTSLPTELVDALKNPLPRVREVAIEDAAQLLRVNDASLAKVAQRELETLASQDIDDRIRAVASTVLASLAPDIRMPDVKLVSLPDHSSVIWSRAPDEVVLEQPCHLELRHIPAGEFLMGSDPARDNDAQLAEQPQQRVYVSEFYIGRFPVTNAQYAIFAEATQRQFNPLAQRSNHPVIGISWEEANEFCEWFTQQTGQLFRLPTEAEWEKAARSADGRLYPWGDEPRYIGSADLDGDTVAVGLSSPTTDSPYGMADASGNICEWCTDWYRETEYSERTGSLVRDPRGPREGRRRMLRGGLTLGSFGVRCADRFWPTAANRRKQIGFRVAAFILQKGNPIILTRREEP